MLDSVTLVLQLGALRNEALAAFLTTTFDEVASCFRCHAGTKTVLVFAGTLRWLICPFHLFRLKMFRFTCGLRVVGRPIIIR